VNREETGQAFVEREVGMRGREAEGRMERMKGGRRGEERRRRRSEWRVVAGGGM